MDTNYLLKWYKNIKFPVRIMMISGNVRIAPFIVKLKTKYL